MTNKHPPPRRVAILAGLGAEIHRLGIGYDDQDAWRGVLEMSLPDFIALFSPYESSADWKVGAALAHVVKSDLGALESFGEAALHERQADAYRADCESWEAQSDSVKRGPWRKKPPSRQQRMLMIRMSNSLQVPLPEDITRGEAALWIAAHGGNPRFKKEK